MAKFTCKSCGGNRFDIVREPSQIDIVQLPSRLKRCRCCGHKVPMLSRRSVKRDRLEAILQEVLKGSKR